MFLAERFHKLLEAEDDLGLIVVDSRFREEDARLRRFFADLTKDGTPFMQLPRIIEGLFLGPSHYSIGLQCADLVVAMTANAERGPGIGPRLHEEADAALCRAPGDGRVRRRRHQALPREGQARAGPAPPVLSRDAAHCAAMRVLLETERLRLRAFTLDDVDLLTELDADPAVMHFINGGRPTPRAEIEAEYLPAWLEYYERYAGYGFWAAIEIATGEFVGWFHLRPRG